MATSKYTGDYNPNSQEMREFVKSGIGKKLVNLVRTYERGNEEELCARDSKFVETVIAHVEKNNDMREFMNCIFIITREKMISGPSDPSSSWIDYTSKRAFIVLYRYGELKFLGISRKNKGYKKWAKFAMKADGPGELHSYCTIL